MKFGENAREPGLLICVELLPYVDRNEFELKRFPNVCSRLGSLSFKMDLSERKTSISCQTVGSVPRIFKALPPTNVLNAKQNFRVSLFVFTSFLCFPRVSPRLLNFLPFSISHNDLRDCFRPPWRSLPCTLCHS